MFCVYFMSENINSGVLDKAHEEELRAAAAKADQASAAILTPPTGGE